MNVQVHDAIVSIQEFKSTYWWIPQEAAKVWYLKKSKFSKKKFFANFFFQFFSFILQEEIFAEDFAENARRF